MQAPSIRPHTSCEQDHARGNYFVNDKDTGPHRQCRGGGLAGGQHAVVHRMYTRTSFAGKVCSGALLKQISADRRSEGVTLEATSYPRPTPDLSRLAGLLRRCRLSKSSNLLAPMCASEGADGGVNMPASLHFPAVRRGDNQDARRLSRAEGHRTLERSPLLQPGDQAVWHDAGRRLGLLRTQRTRSTSPPGRHRCPLSAQKTAAMAAGTTPGMAARHRHPRRGDHAPLLHLNPDRLRPARWRIRPLPGGRPSRTRRDTPWRRWTRTT